MHLCRRRCSWLDSSSALNQKAKKRRISRRMNPPQPTQAAVWPAHETLNLVHGTKAVHIRQNFTLVRMPRTTSAIELDIHTVHHSTFVSISSAFPWISSMLLYPLRPMVTSSSARIVLMTCFTPSAPPRARPYA